MFQTVSYKWRKTLLQKFFFLFYNFANFRYLDLLNKNSNEYVSNIQFININSKLKLLKIFNNVQSSLFNNVQLCLQKLLIHYSISREPDMMPPRNFPKPSSINHQTTCVKISCDDWVLFYFWKNTLFEQSKVLKSLIRTQLHH